MTATRACKLQVWTGNMTHSRLVKLIVHDAHVSVRLHFDDSITTCKMTYDMYRCDRDVERRWKVIE